MATKKRAPVKAKGNEGLVFIGWSGKGSRSQKMAVLLRDWLGQVIQTCTPWYSDVDIASGAAWGSELMTALGRASFGVLCVTPENHTNPWLNYECGMLVGRLSGNVCPLVLDLDPNELGTSPLSRQMAKSALDQASLRQLVVDINDALGDRGVPKEAVEKAFEAFWPGLDFSKLPTAPKTTKRSVDDKVDEVLTVVQTLNTAVSTLVSSQSPSLNHDDGTAWAQSSNPLELFNYVLTPEAAKREKIARLKRRVTALEAAMKVKKPPLR